MRPEASWVERYLGLLGAGRAAPGLEALAALTRRHLLRVPFENVTTLLRLAAWGSRPPAPDPEQTLADWEARRAGGLCYEVAPALGRLLGSLGYACHMVAGQITWPDSHQALAVDWGGRRWLVDAGNGAPLFAPVPLGTVTEIEHAGLGYRFRPGPGPGLHVQERRIRGDWEPFCTFGEGPRRPDDLYRAYCRHHTPGEGKFVGELTLVRCTAGGLERLTGSRLTRFSAAGVRTEDLRRPGDFTRVVDEVFGLPGLPVLDAIEVLRGLGRWPPPEDAPGPPR